MRFDELDDLNIALFAAKFYENPEVSSIDEFHEDLNRTKYIKRLFRKYKQTGVLRERLVLNHLIIMCNVFGIMPANRILFYRIEEEFHSLLKTFLVSLDSLTNEKIPEADLVSIPLDTTVIAVLRRI
ncbi:MAG: hypothetical protein CME98_18010 [Hyphomonas sp.]|nr:hypothetical protein [Hyphomonas sp.]|tara:strand:+ start:4419 stop:4799 length:381 start_codon:yes stop_codon:yes gene_type:complete